MTPGVWVRLNQVLLEEFPRAGKLDWSRAVIDGLASAISPGRSETGPSPADRAKPDSKIPRSHRRIQLLPQAAAGLCGPQL